MLRCDAVLPKERGMHRFIYLLLFYAFVTVLLLANLRIVVRDIMTIWMISLLFIILFFVD